MRAFQKSICDMWNAVSFKFWTQITVSISNADNKYTINTYMLSFKIDTVTLGQILDEDFAFHKTLIPYESYSSTYSHFSYG